MQKLWTGEGTAEVWTKERHSKGSCSREEKLLMAKWPRAAADTVEAEGGTTRWKGEGHLCGEKKAQIKWDLGN